MCRCDYYSLDARTIVTKEMTRDAGVGGWGDADGAGMSAAGGVGMFGAEHLRNV